MPEMIKEYNFLLSPVGANWELIARDENKQPIVRIEMSDADMQHCYHDRATVQARFERYEAGKWVFIDIIPFKLNRP